MAILDFNTLDLDILDLDILDLDIMYQKFFGNINFIATE